MRRLLVTLALAGLMALVGVGAAVARPTASAPVLRAASAPSLTAVAPASAANDIGTVLTITGSGFAATGVPPTVRLGGTVLTQVTLMDDGTLTATVPWGMDPGTFTVSVTTSDGGSASLPDAFTVTAGIGRWNGTSLNGGDVRQILMKPGDSHTLYAPAYGLSGLFRSTDAGASWQYCGRTLTLGNYQLAVSAQHPDWLWAFTYRGVQRSQDRGDTWAVVMPPTWPDGRAVAHGKVYVSPGDPGLLFVSSYHEPLETGSAGDAQGLVRSTDGGASWRVVADLAGQSVLDVAFEPADTTRMVAVCQDGKVFHSGDSGATWSAVASLPLASVGFEHLLAYNPYVTGEVWVGSSDPAGVFKSTDAGLGGWQEVSPGGSPSTGIAFTGAGSVYLTHWRSQDGGATWQPFGPLTGNGSLVFDPTDSQVAYVGDSTCGVQATADGGQTWHAADQGLTGMTCNSMVASRADPLDVFAAFGNWPGIYRSADGASTWSYAPAPGSDNPSMSIVRADATDPSGMRVYAASQHAVYRSDDGGATWSDLGWNTSTPQSDGFIFTVAVDPFQPGHLLAGWDTGAYLTGPGYLYGSSDYGASWQLLTLPQAVARITDIAFDPATKGVVYLATGGAGDITPGTGIYKSVNGGASWRRIDDPKQPGTRDAQTISIATHPRHLLFVGARQRDYRSADGGVTWRLTKDSPGQVYLFANADSTRLYGGGPDGLFFSSDEGDTWTRAAGAFGRLQIFALCDAQSSGRTIVYAATNGGQAGTPAATRSVAASRVSRLGGASTVAAGVYRYVVVKPKVTLKLGGLRRGVLRLGRSVGAKGAVTPRVFAGDTVRLRLQRHGSRWVTLKTVKRTIGARGAYSWSYKPSRRGSYRIRVTIVKTATHLAAQTTWRVFKVR